MEHKAISFCLSGRAAFFKKPDVNEEIYYTYNNIHRIALLGILGAILGLMGYRNEKIFHNEKRSYPEFYEKLRDIKVSIVPKAKKGYFSKKIQYFNNSTGFASGEQGGNLMVREQWLENPSWTIYLMQGNIETTLWEELCKRLLNQSCYFIPYFGKNDFPVKISDVNWVELHRSDNTSIQSIFYGVTDWIDDEEDTYDGERSYIFQEYSPCSLIEWHNFYEYKKTIFTNYPVSQEAIGKLDLYCDGKNNLSFS